VLPRLRVGPPSAGIPAVPVTGMLLTWARCSDPAARDEWEAWWDDVHLADVGAAIGSRRATRWMLTTAGPAQHAGLGFTHVAMYELDDVDGLQVERTVDVLARNWSRLWSEGRVHPRHVLAGVDGLVGHGPSGHHPEAAADLTGRILAFILCTDPARADEWDAWYDAEHLPDMMATGAFAAGSRWRRVRPAAFAPRLATLYDVAGMPVDEAVAISGAAMPGLVAAGRKPSWHAGGLTVVVEPVGSHGPAGWRADG
jgi:hypothetical protein